MVRIVRILAVTSSPAVPSPRVTARSRASVFVGERDGRAVEFELADELRLSELFLDASDEFVQLVERIGIAQRKHRKAVFDALEFGCEIAADAGRRGVRVGVFRMCRLQFLQLAHQDVEFDDRIFPDCFRRSIYGCGSRVCDVILLFFRVSYLCYSVRKST